MAQAEELRGHVQAFKGDGGRRVSCHSEGLGNVTTFLASVCDELSLAPLGGINIPGPAGTPVHIKGLLDKLGITADFIHVGAFKSGPEPITHTAPSKESLEVLQAITDGSYERMVAGIAEGRGLERTAVEDAINQAIWGAEKAKDAGLIDHVETYDAFRARASGGEPWKRIKLGGGPKFDDPLAMQRFLGILPPDLPREPHVAVVYAVGNVVDGVSGGIVGASGEIASRPLSAALRAVAADERVAAVVLRVDSPGGSALASEQIHLATLELTEKKPLVVSMGSLAASGGYYISAGAKRIFAQPDTLTGSIGVFGGKLAVGRALEKIGVNSYEVSRGERGLMWSAMEIWSEGEREAVRESMQLTYDRFLDRVASGRGMTREGVHEVAQGRVWTGVEAKERGLVDELGGLDEAVAAAAELGNVADGVGLEFYPPEPTLKDLLAGLGSSSSPLGVRAQLSRELIAQLDPELAARVEGLLGLVLADQELRVWAASFVYPPR
jgi:protease-4